jgi:aspartate kinase
MSPDAQQDLASDQRSAGALDPAYRGEIHSSTNEIVAFKFGGTSLLGADRMLHAAGLVSDAVTSERNVVVVVSAMKGITDRLLAIVRALEAGCRSDARRDAEHVLRLHLEVLRDLHLDPSHHDRVARELDYLGKDRARRFAQTQPSAAVRPALQDRIASYGERFSARFSLRRLIVPSSLSSGRSSEFVPTCNNFRDALPQIEETPPSRPRNPLAAFASGLSLSSPALSDTPDGRVTTLGRNSSDYSAALIAHVVDADELVIWTDVDGIYTANPHESTEAKLLHELSYDQAHALAAAGAKVLHPKVLPLAAENEMVVWVRNTFNPQFRGTRIAPASGSDSSVPAPDGCHNSNLRGAA